jgi:hypothetical protein
MKVGCVPSSKPEISRSATNAADEHRHWLKRFFSLVASATFAVAASNLLVNPLGYYPVRVIRPLTWSSRETKAAIVRTAPPFQVLILGSSRTMKFAPNEVHALTGMNAVNAAIDSAHVEDLYATLQLALSRSRGVDDLKAVIVGVDPEAFHDHAAPDPRLFGVPELARRVPVAMQATIASEACRTLFSAGQFAATLRSLRMRFVDGYPVAESSFDTDGLLHYVKWEREIAEGTFVPDIASSVEEYEGRYAGFDALDPTRKALFSEMVALASRQHISVRAFITPLHDRVRERLREQGNLEARLVELRAFLSEVATNFPSFTWVDYLDVRSFGGDPTAFFDGAHARDANMSKLAHALLRGGNG